MMLQFKNRHRTLDMLDEVKMTSPRLNIFSQIHKGLRALMFDTAVLAQQTDYGDGKQAAIVLDRLELMLSMFEAHAWHEDSCILDEARKYAPGLIEEFEQEHETDLRLSVQLKEQIENYKAINSSEGKSAAGYQVLYSLNEFIAFNLIHMNKEEQELNKVLWERYTNEEILQMERKIQSMVAPEKRPVYLKWMVKGLNNSELVQWLLNVKCNAPEAVLDGLLEEFSTNLPAQRWEVIQSFISEGSMVQ